MNEERTFTITFAKGHPTITVDGNIYIVDTGCPNSYASSDKIRLCGLEFQANAAESIVDNLCAALETKVNGLIGGDILKQFGAVEIDFPNTKVTFHEVLPQASDLMKIDLAAGTDFLIFNMGIDGNMRRVILDTGAPTPYLSYKIIPERDPDGSTEDVTPWGAFSSPLYTLETEFAGKKFNVKYGILPDMHLALAESLQCDGVIGKDIFDLGTIIVDYAEEELYLKFEKNGFSAIS